MFGLLNVHKPAGMTSRDVVNRIQRVVRPAKVGHAGTLDPLATGVLIVLVGNATRLTDYAHLHDKTYVGEFRLGQWSDTEDIEGNVIAEENPRIPTREELEGLLPRFVGEISQRPPAYSALKVGGERAYDLARQGKAVELASRMIEVHSIKVLKFEYPHLQMEITCGSGTYIRSLGRDVAEAAGTCAVMTSLVRTRIGPWHLQNAKQLEELGDLTAIQERLLPAKEVVSLLESLVATPDEIIALSHGKKIARSFEMPQANGTELAVLTETGELAAVVVIEETNEGTPISPVHVLRVVKFFPDCLAKA
ncbi:MAG: tRNA pseudouridine(55) synthase TruB [Planctomycetaceae bacterium]